MHTLCSKLFILMFCLLTMLPKLNISGSSCTKKSSYLTNIVLGCASLICLSLYIFSGNSHNENIIPSCQPCVLTVCAPLVCIKKTLSSLAALGLALIGILHLIFVYNLFLTIVTLKNNTFSWRPCAWRLCASLIWLSFTIWFWQKLH